MAVRVQRGVQHDDVRLKLLAQLQRRVMAGSMADPVEPVGAVDERGQPVPEDRNRVDGGDDVYWKSERMARAAADSKTTET